MASGAHCDGRDLDPPVDDLPRRPAGRHSTTPHREQRESPGRGDTPGNGARRLLAGTADREARRKRSWAALAGPPEDGDDS
jgi:hypothetical protein